MKVSEPIVTTPAAAHAGGRLARGFVALLAALTTACTAPGQPGGLPAAVDAVFARYSATDGPGCSVGVIQDGRLIGSEGYGMANLDHGIANGPATVFRSGSVSKQFTAGAIALLALRGDLDLDAPVRRYLPDFPAYPDPPTVRHLVHHTSGVRDYVGLMRLSGNRDEDFFTDPEVIAAINRQRELNFRPGDDYLYSNAGYFLLGRIVAAVSGQSLREFAETHFFAPLGMTDTHFHDDHNEVVLRRATGYSPTGDGFRINVTTLDMVGDGGVFTSVEDWVAWDRNLETGTVGGAEWVALMHRRGVLNSGDTIPYAFGIVHGEHRGLATVGHGGAWVGYRAGMTRYPETGHSFVALCNRSQIDPMGLLATTAEVYLEERMTPLEDPAAPDGETTPDAGADEADEDPPSEDITNRDRYAGSFYSPELDATYHIAEAGAAGLSLHVGKWDPATLSELDDGVLRSGGLTFRFSDLADGRFSSMVLDAGRVRNLGFTRVDTGYRAGR